MHQARRTTTGRTWLAGLIGVAGLLGAAGTCGAADPQAGKQVERSFTPPGSPDKPLGYLLYVPPGFGEPGKKFPTILFLHGAGERGTGNLPLVAKHGPPKRVLTQTDFPFVVVSPQCPANERWNVETLTALLDEVVKTLPVDADRLYLTGLSMGGYGSWTLAAAHPERFAAVVPICGGGDPSTAEKLTALPIRVYHGAKDTAVPLKRSEEMVEAVKKAGGKSIELFVDPEAGHDSWSKPYGDPQFYAWLLQHRRAK